MKSKILVVDDEPDVVEFLKKRLERTEFQVITALDGKGCILKAGQEKPDLILLDIMMPLVDGYEVVRRLRENEATSSIPVIMHSARRETNAILTSIELGSIDYVTKPVSFDDLLKVIRKYIL